MSEDEFQFVTPETSVAAQVARGFEELSPEAPEMVRASRTDASFTLDGSELLRSADRLADVAGAVRRRGEELGEHLENDGKQGIIELGERSDEALHSLMLLAAVSSAPEEYVEPIAVLGLVCGLLEQMDFG